MPHNSFIRSISIINIMKGGNEMKLNEIEKQILLNAGITEEKMNGADLSGANLSCANLSYANLSGADLRGTDLSEVRINESTFGIVSNCPEEGSFIAYKKCKGKVVKLLITEDAKRSSATTYKCRASKAKVLEIEGGLDEIRSDYDSDFIYKVGEIVEVHDFDENRWNECSSGIHFFMSKEMAKQY